MQNAQRLAATGIVLKHSGQTLVAGAAGSAGLLMRRLIAFIGTMTKK